MADRDREGYILIDRNILDWKWWQKHNTLVVFLWLLIKANFHESYFAGVKIERGQIATTIGKIESNNKMTRQEVKTSLVHLKTTGEITIDRHPQFLVITIVNYDRYQNLNIKSNNDQTSNKHHSAKNQTYPNTYNITKTDKRRSNKKGRCAPVNPSGFADMAYADTMPPPGEGTVDDIPAEMRDQFADYDEYWRFRNR